VELKISENKTVINDGEILKQIGNSYRDLHTSQFCGLRPVRQFLSKMLLCRNSLKSIGILWKVIQLFKQECRKILKTVSDRKSLGEDSKTFSPQTIALTREAKLWEDTRDSQGNWRVECRIQQ